MADTPKHSVSVAGIVVDDQNRVLVIQRRDNGHWEPPGGVLELDETPDEGLRREVYVETGLDIEIMGITGVYKNLTRGVVALVFRCTSKGGTLRTSDESMRVAWMRLDEVREAMTPAYSIRIEDAFRSTVSVRAHDGLNLL